MKRKTNLFYTTGPDSKFITFSNYTEALTGNFLSVSSKLFPNRFMCLKINGLNAITKEMLIKYLAKYYENKLAVLRDDCVNHGDNVENIYPLGYLIDAILKVVNKTTNTLNEGLAVSNISLGSKTGLITYVGDITEFDYNGTYTDIICNINMSSYKHGIINTVTRNNSKTCTVQYPKSLYGWENDNITFDEYYNEIPVFDDEKTKSYSYDPATDNISIVSSDEISISEDIQFNVIIPLFSYINSNNANNVNLEDSTEINAYSEYSAIVDVPLGLWIYADKEEDTFITLSKDPELNAYPSWSLLISTQFKPFPYSKNILNKDNSTSESSLNAFTTFAEVLTKMNDVLDSFSSMNVSLANLANRLNTIESQIRNIATDANIGKLQEQMIDISLEFNNKIEEINQKIIDLKWSSVG